ncbi:HD domain-containing protein [bacterium]|nr:HD domain-containing protein [bacterium]
MEIPKEIIKIIEKLKKNGFQAYIVGGCVRDLLLARQSLDEGGRKAKPKDWDIATNAKPEQVAKIFPKHYIDNKFGTVKVLTKSKDPSLREIEITTFRIEERYTDKRHPDQVKWAKTIEQDLARRDFTINAMALKIKNEKLKIKNLSFSLDQDLELIDPFLGQEDLINKVIRAVGDPDERFQEDALRLMRAIRFATTLNFKIEPKTYKAIKRNAGLLEFISKERIRDELMKIIMSKNAAKGIDLLRETGLLKYIIPELLEGYKVGQNKHHIYDVYEHSLRSLDFAAKKGFNKYVRLAALLHDIGKPRTKRGEGPDSTFYGHEVVGARMTAQILNRLRFSKKDIEKIVKLVRYHLFYYNVGEVTESSVRRLLRKVGKENIEELVQLRMADRIGSGCPKALPYRLRHFLYVVEKVSQDPIDTRMLKIDGNKIMEILNIEPGPKIGQILDILLSEVLEDPDKNNGQYLEKRTKELGQLSDKELTELTEMARNRINEIVEKRDEMTKKRYWVS